MSSPNSDEDVARTTEKTLPEPLEKAIRKESFDSLSDARMVRDQVFAEAISIPQEKTKKRIIFSELVPEEGFTWILKETGVLVKFFPKAVPDPRLVTCSLWTPGIVSPLLENNESLVSNVIELDCDDPHDVVFSSIEVALSHSSICLRGYELVLKEMADSKGLHWKDLRTSEVQPSDLQGECSDWKTKLPFVKAKITSFSRYAIVCRLKNYKLRKEDSGERPEVTISIQDFPGFCLSSPRTSFPASATKRTLGEFLGEPSDPISDGGIVQDQEAITIPQEESKNRIIFSDLVSEEGFTWILKETGVLIKFLSKAVPDPRLVTCSLWKPGTVSPHLDENESLVSYVIELHCDDPHDVVFSSIEVALSHSAFCLRGYELTMKEMANSERLPWRDLHTSKVEESELQGVCSGWTSELPFVKAKITRFSRYAVFCRLKDYKLPKEDSEERSELTISVPDFPGFCLSIPGTSFPSSMDLVIKVQELSPHGFEGKRILVGPVVHFTFTPEVKLRDPLQVSLTCPILLKVPIEPQQHQIKLSEMSSRHVRVFFRGGKDTSRKWVDWSKKLKGEPKLEKGIVAFEVDGTDTFQTNHLSECGVILDSSTEPLDAEKLFIVDSSCPQQVGFFAFWCQKEKQQRQDLKQGSLTLCCYPLHMKTELTKKLSSEHGVLLYGEGESARKLAKGDQAHFSLSNGLTLVDIDYTPVVFKGDVISEYPFSVSFDAPTIEFFKKENDKEGQEKLCSLRLHPVEPFKDRSLEISKWITQSEEEPPICEPSPSVDDSAQIEKLRGSVVTQKLATRFKDPIGNCWKDLGPYLELPESKLHNIDTDYVEAREKGGAVLQSWRDKKGCKATVGHLVSVLHKIGMKRIADELLGIVGEEKRRESEHHETCSNPVEEGETRQRQARERESSPETIPSTAEEVYVTRTRHKEQSGRRNEWGSERRNTNEFKRVARLEEVRKNNWLTRKSKLDEPPRRQQNTKRNEPLEMMKSLLMEVAALKGVIEQNILMGIAGNGNVEGLREITEKVRKVRQDFS